MVKSTRIQSKKNGKESTFGNSCVQIYEVYPPNKKNLHERQIQAQEINILLQLID